MAALSHSGVAVSLEHHQFVIRPGLTKCFLMVLVMLSKLSGSVFYNPFAKPLGKGGSPKMN